MNKLGILVDVSHCGDKTMMDAIKYSQKPIAITHANPRKFNSHHRQNRSTDLALAEKGGVIGMTAWTPISSRTYTVKDTEAKAKELDEKFKAWAAAQTKK